MRKMIVSDRNCCVSLLGNLRILGNLRMLGKLITRFIAVIVHRDVTIVYYSITLVTQSTVCIIIHITWLAVVILWLIMIHVDTVRVVWDIVVHILCSIHLLRGIVVLLIDRDRVEALPISVVVRGGVGVGHVAILGGAS